jgi:UDP-N-acetylglucosamine/UDP-N-acetylgalactosamine diphosphorylase
MTSEIPAEILSKLTEYAQEHLVTGWELLGQSDQKQFEEQIRSVAFAQINDLLSQKTGSNSTDEQGSDGINPEEATAPADIIRFNDQEPDSQQYLNAKKLGQQAIKSGQVGAVLVAGGQGTRLGFPYAKGMFEIGPLSGKSLFQIFVEQLLALSLKFDCSIPYFIMTSDANHEETVGFFEKNDYFGYQSDQIFFFKQGVMPAVDAKTGKLLLADPGKLALGPDGHGGLLNAIEDAGLLQMVNDLGIEYLFYHQVDNPTAILCDPLLLGHHIHHQSEMTTKVVAKRSPDEKMGVVCDYQGETRIIEYSDMSEEVARKKDPSGEIIHWAGNMAIHVFNVKFITKLLTEHFGLPVHIAHKKVPYWDHSTQDSVEPEEPNAYKFEKFIFDALPFASKALVVEADREAEFNPVKNATGDDSPGKVKQAMSQLHQKWLESAGFEVADNVIVEISPLIALSSEDLEVKKDLDREIKIDTYFEESSR